MLCDVCNGEVTAANGKRVGKQTFSKLLDLGFGIHPHILDPLIDAGMCREAAVQMLRENFKSLDSDWLLCETCFKEAAATKKAAERSETRSVAVIVAECRERAQQQEDAIRERDALLWKLYSKYFDHVWAEHRGSMQRVRTSSESIKHCLLSSAFIAASYQIMGDKRQRDAMAQGYAITSTELGYDLEQSLIKHVECEASWEELLIDSNLLVFTKAKAEMVVSAGLFITLIGIICWIAF